MFNRICNIMSQLFIYGLSIKMNKTDCGGEVKLKLKNFLIKDQEINGIIIENLHLSMENISDMNKCVSFDDASFIVEKIDFLISEDWINKIIKSEEILKGREIEELRIDFHQDGLSVSGKIKVGITFSFTMDLKLTIEKGKLKIIFNKFHAGGFITLPSWLQKALLSILKNYLESRNMLDSGIIFTNEYVIIDHLSFIPLDCYLKFEEILIEEKYLIIKGGEDRDKCLEIIEKKLKKKIEEMKKQKAKEKDKKKDKEEDKVNKILDEIIQKAGEMKRLKPAKPVDSSNSKVKVYVDGEPVEFQEDNHSIEGTEK